MSVYCKYSAYRRWDAKAPKANASFNCYLPQCRQIVDVICRHTTTSMLSSNRGATQDASILCPSNRGNLTSGRTWKQRFPPYAPLLRPRLKAGICTLCPLFINTPLGSKDLLPVPPFHYHPASSGVRVAAFPMKLFRTVSSRCHFIPRKTGSHLNN